MYRIRKIKHPFVFVSVFLVILAFGLSCEHADPVQPEQLVPTFPSIQSNIFNLNCALSGCHIGSNPAGGLNLSEGIAYGNLVGVSSQEVSALQRVNPGDPDNSYLVIKLEGTDSRLQGERMPRGREPLTQEQINVIRQWIADGALPAGNAPVVNDIPDQAISLGQSFNSFDLDDFVTDADHPDSLINWTFSMSAGADTVLSVSIDAGHMVTIDIINSTFVGSETITFTATDPDGLSDSDDAHFTVLPPSLSLIQQAIFGPKCAMSGCHVGGSNQLPGSMNLSTKDSTYADIVNIFSQERPTLLRVKPGDPDSSYVIWKIEGRSGIFGGRMPLVGDTLMQNEVDLIKTWIQEGAPNN
jgi:hypothetical protein